MRHLWDSYWAWAGGNIVAMPLEALITVTVTVVFRRPVGRFIGWLAREERQAWADLLRAAQEAQRISEGRRGPAADEARPGAPGEGSDD